MSKNRKRHWHFTLRQSRPLFTEHHVEIEFDFVDSSTRVVLKAPDEKIRIPPKVERAVVGPPPTKEELMAKLAECKRRVRIMRMGEAQRVFTKEELWNAEWELEKLRSQVGERNPDGSRVRHPGPLARYIDAKFKDLKARVRDR